MKFLAITLIVHAPDPITGVQKPTTERFREVISNAQLAEELGFDGFGVGERHERPFISSSPPVVLSHAAALTSRIRLFTAVTTLSLLDPVRAYEDYATLFQSDIAPVLRRDIPDPPWPDDPAPAPALTASAPPASARRRPAAVGSAPLESAPLESAPLESAPLESAPLESAQ